MSAYYNENDPKAAAWLRELISAGHIAPGEVDERSISDVRPTDLLGFTQCHFFAGVGGWSLALRLAGVPDSRPVWTGSCPCQPFSAAGKQLGEADARHLWPEFFRLIRAARPELVAGEQVERAVGLGWLDGVFADLEGEGYSTGAAVLGAHSVGAPHIRQRLYWMAHANSRKRGGLADGEGRQRHGSPAGWEQSDGESECSCPTRGLADMQRAGLEGHAGDGDNRHESVAQGGGDGRVADSSGLPRAQHEHESRGEARRRSPEANSSECGGTSERRARPWDAFDIIPCRDGKARRIEPGSFPLVARLPAGMVPSSDPSVQEVQATAEGRVMRLRGYGNSIVPELAAQFISASLEAIYAV